MDLYVQALVMGIVQGLTEFLPISSSGHLILLPALLGWTNPFIDSLRFSVILHLGTLLALLLYFARDWLVIVGSLVGLVRDRSTRGDPARRLALNLAIATVPAAVAGYLLNDAVETTVRDPFLVAVLLLVGAAVLLMADRLGRKLLVVDDLRGRDALAIGLAQALALLPGISRSGISISMALWLGLERAAAARFSFLMATPIIAGAGLFELRKALEPGSTPAEGFGLLAIGFVAALISGLVAIRFMLRYLRTRSLAIFVVYRALLGVAAIVLLLGR